MHCKSIHLLVSHNTQLQGVICLYIILQVVVIENEHTYANDGKSKAQMIDDHFTYSNLTILRAHAKPSPATEMTEYASVRIRNSDVLNV